MSSSLNFRRLAPAALFLTILSVGWATPVVEQPPPGSQWKVTILQRNASAPAKDESGKPAADGQQPNPAKEKEAADKSAAHPALLEIQTDRSNITKGVISNSDGTSRTFYLIKGVVFVPGSDSGRILRYPSRKDDPFWLETNRFPGTDWITEQHLVQDPLKRADAPTQYRLKGLFSLEAQIRPNERRPITVTLGDELVYEFGPVEVFEGPIAVPESILQAAQEVSRKQESIQAIHKANTRQTR